MSVKMWSSLDQFLNYKDQFTHQWPLMNSPKVILTIIISYLVLSISGPKVMRNRKPIPLGKTMTIYNGLQVILSLWMFYLSLSGFQIFWEFKSRYSYIKQYPSYKNNAIWWCFMSRIIDIADTVFIILRKKFDQLSFLHVYHHFIMLVLPWFYLKYTPGDFILVPCVFNTFVHTLMYFYYFLSALGPKVTKYLWWKKYLTQIQLIQFSAILLYDLVTIIKDPSSQRFPIAIHAGLSISFVLLFSKFYKKSYKEVK